MVDWWIYCESKDHFQGGKKKKKNVECSLRIIYYNTNVRRFVFYNMNDMKINEIIYDIVCKAPTLFSSFGIRTSP